MDTPLERLEALMASQYDLDFLPCPSMHHPCRDNQKDNEVSENDLQEQDLAESEGSSEEEPTPSFTVHVFKDPTALGSKNDVNKREKREFLVCLVL